MIKVLDASVMDKSNYVMDKSNHGVATASSGWCFINISNVHVPKVTRTGHIIVAPVLGCNWTNISWRNTKCCCLSYFTYLKCFIKGLWEIFGLEKKMKLFWHLRMRLKNVGFYIKNTHSELPKTIIL